MPDLTNTSTDVDLVPEAGGHPVRLVTAAAEHIRAANHATFDRRPVPGLAAGADIYDTVGALHQLANRLPQLLEQLATLLTTAAEQGTLTGPKTAPALAAAELTEAASSFRDSRDHLDAAWQLLGPVGGWLSADAAALADDREE
jgi:hypothetical protein